MPFDTKHASPRRIAVIGGGISGMAAAHLLGRNNRVVLLEAAARLGGHARTVTAGRRGDQPVDTGFIVFNYENYPNLTALFEQLDVPVAKSDMSFGASVKGGRIEYGLRDLRAVFAQPRNLANPKFLRMIRDVVRFNSQARATAQSPDMSIGSLLLALETGPWFRDYYLLPLSGAIWSMPPEQILDFPAEAMIRFFENHALLHHTGQHEWWTIKGGSIEYVRRLAVALAAAGVELRTSTPVCSVRRNACGAEVRTKGGLAEQFDDVVFATHSDDTLALLVDPSPEERRTLGAVRYQSNHAILHADTSVMPRTRRAWSSWVFTEAKHSPRSQIDLTYWMNSLQPIPMDDPMFVTLNSSRRIREDLIYDQKTFRHPVYDLAAIQAQNHIRAMNGANRTWFCGAWMRNGFHEDGFASAVDVVDAMALRDRMGIAAE